MKERIVVVGSLQGQHRSYYLVTQASKINASSRVTQLTMFISAGQSPLRVSRDIRDAA